jgi:mevalonate kinase
MPDEKQAKLGDVLVLLTEAQIRTEERFQEVGQRFRETDERIGKLVSAIGELVRSATGV